MILKNATLMTGIVALFASGACIGSTFYVSPTGAHNPPYNTVGKAATNLQTAVDAAVNVGDKVLILDGTYYLSMAIIITNAISVESLNGPADVIINGSGISRCFELEDVDCMLNGLTIANGHAAGDGGGILCGGLSPVITHCVIEGNQAAYGGGILGGTIKHCIIRGNIAENNGGGADRGTVGCEIFNTIIVSNVASNDGGGLYGCTVYDSLLVSNTAVYGGGASSSDLYNCTLVGNVAEDGGGADYCYVYNSIVLSNVATVYSGDDITFPDTVANTCSSASDVFVHGVDGNLVLDPMFVDFTSGDYQLQSGSPCINAGNNVHVVDMVDLQGNPRISNVFVDMGAYEHQLPIVDTDKDGMNDDEELIAGTDPTNSASFFAITNWSAGGGLIQWPAFSNREYRVYRASSLTNTFEQIGPVIEYPQNSYADTAHSAESGGFYKVEVQLQ